MRAILVSVLLHNSSSKQPNRTVSIPVLVIGVGGIPPAEAANQMRVGYDCFFSSRRRHTSSVSAFLLNRSSDLQCYNVLPQLDINNTIDHRPEGDEKWFLENEKTVTQFCRKLAAERPLKDIRDEYNYPKKKGIKDECSRLLEASTMKSRRGF